MACQVDEGSKRVIQVRRPVLVMVLFSAKQYYGAVMRGEKSVTF